ncbi:MAG: phosphoribosyl-AMP cyclohydrolase [Armatimonadota bacterium]|nr:MAG: phosphoribosyl-AMP cyclohydrolase [Armatimonadota bacterium]
MELPELKYGADGLVPAIAQDAGTGEVLMVAYMNAEAFRQTVETGYATYFSRSRQKLWVKGETSGNRQRVLELYLDCDLDAVLMKIEQIGGAACHTGFRSCFYRKLEDGELEVVGEKVFEPEQGE